MRVAVFGGSGQVATELLRRIPEGVTVERIGRDRADFSDPEQVLEAARTLGADAAINAVAYTSVDKAEEEPDLAATVNGASVAALLAGCTEAGVPLVHLSTDYVFSGEGETPWNPRDPTAPKGAYGRSKLLGEAAFAEHPDHPAAVLRTSWVFSAHGANFVKTMLRVGPARGEVSVVDDQVGGPTPAADIADACYGVATALARGANGGLHHFAGAPDVSWADFACETFSASGLTVQVKKIPSSGYPTLAERPKNSRLDCRSLTDAYGIERADWRKGLRDVLKELGAI